LAPGGGKEKIELTGTEGLSNGEILLFEGKKGFDVMLLGMIESKVEFGALENRESALPNKEETSLFVSIGTFFGSCSIDSLISSNSVS
jgi:hypothetical protein